MTPVAAQVSQIDLVFGEQVDPRIKSEYLNTLFSKYLIPKLSMFREVDEETYNIFRKSGTEKKARWHDRHHNAFGLRLFNKGPWFLIVNPANSVEYGKEIDDLKYYELPNFEEIVKTMILNEREHIE